jgi:hypothetical protein
LKKIVSKKINSDEVVVEGIAIIKKEKLKDNIQIIETFFFRNKCKK